MSHWLQGLRSHRSICYLLNLLSCRRLGFDFCSYLLRPCPSKSGVPPPPRPLGRRLRSFLRSNYKTIKWSLRQEDWEKKNRNWKHKSNSELYLPDISICNRKPSTWASKVRWIKYKMDVAEAKHICNVLFAYVTFILYFFQLQIMKISHTFDILRGLE